MILNMVNISKYFPGVQALNNVDLSLRKGEVHALVGENGAGKSTLIKVLTGVYKEDTGEIMIKGNRVKIVSPREAQKNGISVVYQESKLVPKLSVLANIFLGREKVIHPFNVLNGNQLKVEFKQLCERLEIKELSMNEPVENLSVALRQMVEIVRAVSYNSDILIFDEPTSSLTKNEKDKLFRIISILKEQGKSIIYITHFLNEIFQIADRVTVLRDGKNVDTLPISQVSKEDLIKLMVGRKVQEFFIREPHPIGEVILEVRNLKKGKILDDISFKLRKGEILGIAGLVGAGRTELVNAIFGYIGLDSGQIFINGKQATIKDPIDAINMGIALITEDRIQKGLITNFEVYKNITIASLKQFSPRMIIHNKEELKKSDYYVNELNIKTPSLLQQVAYLSGGNQQKVILSKWLNTNSKIFLFDEPTRGIDVGAKTEIFKLIENLAKKEAGIVFISSELPEVMNMSDRILVMREGKISAEFNKIEATQESIMTAALHI
ncbi:MAG: sugar ABC transporter ATP-binding protein [Actinobacteria bacterium]|nr:sugar ABC transporter ATP-binding protein [Actinomycetota bacterium]